MIRRPPRSTQSRSSAASDVYKRQFHGLSELVGGELENLAWVPRPGTDVFGQCVDLGVPWLVGVTGGKRWCRGPDEQDVDVTVRAGFAPGCGTEQPRGLRTHLPAIQFGTNPRAVSYTHL